MREMSHVIKRAAWGPDPKSKDSCGAWAEREYLDLDTMSMQGDAQ